MQVIEIRQQMRISVVRLTIAMKRFDLTEWISQLNQQMWFFLEEYIFFRQSSAFETTNVIGLIGSDNLQDMSKGIDQAFIQQSPEEAYQRICTQSEAR